MLDEEVHLAGDGPGACRKQEAGGSHLVYDNTTKPWSDAYGPGRNVS